MSDTSLAVREAGQLTLMPVMSIQQAVERYAAIVQFVSKLMNEGVDYGAIPGAGDKKTLLKPGAEKLATFFGLSKRFILVEKTEDWTGKDHDGEAFFNYLYRCALYVGETLIAESDASANSFESKYRYRKGERTCPACGVAAIIKGKAEYGGGWICFGKKGGCGAKFSDNSLEISSQMVGRILNADICDQVNTLQKMAQKRALVGAVLLAVNASEFFTQDLDDFENGETVNVTPTENKPAQQQKQAAKPAPARQTQTSAAETELNNLLFAHCKKLKTNDKAAKAYFDAVFGALTFDQKQAKAIELGLAATTTEQHHDHDALLESIETLSIQLNDLGITQDDIASYINATTEGKQLEGCTTDVLQAIEKQLKADVEKQKAAAA